jgi:cyclophilin family peptidyl-prolyl cis-trans isomerase
VKRVRSPSASGRAVVPLLAALMVALVSACATQLTRLPGGLPSDPPPLGPDSFVVVFETTKGPFSVLARRNWSPRGVDRFYDLVRRGFYDEVSLYRIVEGFVAQFGHTDSAAVNTAWRARGLPDERVVASNTRGRVAFARAGPTTRTYQLFINLADNPRLDTLSASGIVGYPPIGEVVEGMENVLRFDSRWGGQPSANQDSIMALGRSYLDRVYPGLDRITSARISRRWR